MSVVNLHENLSNLFSKIAGNYYIAGDGGNIHSYLRYYDISEKIVGPIYTKIFEYLYNTGLSEYIEVHYNPSNRSRIFKNAISLSIKKEYENNEKFLETLNIYLKLKIS